MNSSALFPARQFLRSFGTSWLLYAAAIMLTSFGGGPLTLMPGPQ
jgi:hypothetical protein